MNLFKKALAEFFGTFVLVFVACGTAVVCGCDATNGSGYLLTALAFGLVIVAMAYSVGNVSGCHINPAVSLAMLIAGKMKFVDFIVYVVAQFAGATTGAALLWALFGKDTGLGANGLYQNNLWKSAVIEVILTFIFVLVILAVTSKEEYSKPAGLIIGFTLTLVHIIGIGLTGTSVNPARSFGPAIFVGGVALENVWLFIVAPLVGGALAALVFKLFKKKD